MIDELMLLTGDQIPFVEAQLTIHQPTLKEIGYITQHRFWIGCELLKFDKENLSNQDKIDLSNQQNFDIIMSMIQQKEVESVQARINILSILTLLFPNYQIQLGKKSIQLHNQIENKTYEINSDNFQSFKTILIAMFCLKETEKQYNPSGELAKKIADKFLQAKKKRQKLAAATFDADKKISILSRYMSILAVGENKDLNELRNYTVYQLMDEFTRFTLKMNYDMWLKYKIAGATDLQDPQDWLKDIYTKNDNYNSGNDDWLEVIQ